MEVHHHPDVEKKNFKEYFLEFIMIFLAVTMGFIAENIRENISDNRQLHEYMQSMVSDLKSDEIMYDSAISLNLIYCQMIDTIFASLNQNTSNTGKIYYMARKLTTGNYVISPNAKTFGQMTSTGGLRFVRHQQIADSIALYYQLIKMFDYWSDLQRQRVNDLIAVNDKLFDARVFFSVYKALETTSNTGQIIPQNNPPLITNDPLVINTVLMRYQYFYGFLKLMNQRALLGLERSKRLIILLQKEYKINNE